MPSSTVTLADAVAPTPVDHVYALVGSTARGATYRSNYGTMLLPETLDLSQTVGTPGSKGNDKYVITLRLSKADDNNVIGTGSVSLMISAPRHSMWSEADTKNLLQQMQQLLTGTGNEAALADFSLEIPGGS